MGLACCDERFLQGVSYLQKNIPASMKYHDAVKEIDKILFGFYCPLGHLDVQLFYDSLFNQAIWTNCKKVLDNGAFRGFKDPSKRSDDEFFDAVGLACVDPWDKDPTGFRERMSVNAKAYMDFGLRLEPEESDRIHAALSNPDGIVMNAMRAMADCWDPITRDMVTLRAGYPRLKPNQFPPGWVKRNIP